MGHYRGRRGEGAFVLGAEDASLVLLSAGMLLDGVFYLCWPACYC